MERFPRVERVDFVLCEQPVFEMVRNTGVVANAADLNFAVPRIAAHSTVFWSGIVVRGHDIDAETAVDIRERNPEGRPLRTSV